jgi:starvation-inducible outer membrane lipoprotein
MKQLIILIGLFCLTACSSTPKQLSDKEAWVIQRACQFFHDIHPEENMGNYEECKGLTLQNNKMPEN